MARDGPGELEVDVLVAGGGIAGAALADALARVHGRSVAVVERNVVSGGTSGLAAGTLSVPGPVPRGGSKDSWGNWVAITSMGIYKQLEAEGFGDDLGLRRTGSVTMAITDEQAEEVRREFQALRACGYVDNELVENQRRLAEIEPSLDYSPFKLALFQPWSICVDPGAAARAFEERAKRYGAIVIENDAVAQVHRVSKDREAKFKVSTRSGREILARNVVLATGCESDVLIVDGQRQFHAPAMVRTKAHGVSLPQRRLKRIVFCSDLYARHLFFTHATAKPDERLAFHTYGRPGFEDPENSVWFGVDRAIVSAGDFSVRASQFKEASEFLSRVAPKLFSPPQSPPTLEDVAWTCHMPFSPAKDGMPLYGKVAPGLYLAMGLGPQGIERAPALGEWLADAIVSGSRHPGLAAVDPFRQGGVAGDVFKT